MSTQSQEVRAQAIASDLGDDYLITIDDEWNRINIHPRPGSWGFVRVEEDEIGKIRVTLRSREHPGSIRGECVLDGDPATRLLGTVVREIVGAAR